MNDMPDNVFALTQQGRPTPPEVKEEAFRLWVAYGRSWRLVAKQMDIPERTLQRWADAGNWEERRRNEAASFLPGMTTEGAIAARIAGHNAMVRLQQISQDALEFGIKPDKNEVLALTMIADRGGYAHVGTKQAPAVELRQPESSDDEDLSKLSDDELMERELRYRGRKR